MKTEKKNDAKFKTFLFMLLTILKLYPSAQSILHQSSFKKSLNALDRLCVSLTFAQMRLIIANVVISRTDVLHSKSFLLGNSL